jgi:hypothetical protein
METMKFIRISAYLILSLVVFRPVIAQTPPDTIINICAGIQNDWYHVNNTTGYDYYWSLTGGGTFTVAPPVIGDNVYINWQLTAGVDTLKVVAVNPATGCPGDTFRMAIIRILPPVMVIPPARIICSGDSANYSPLADIPGTSFDWTASTSGTITGYTPVGSGDIADLLINTGITPGTVTYHITPTGPPPTNCPGIPADLVVTVNPTPTVTGPANQVVCNNSPTATVTFTGSVTGTVYNWTNDDISIGLAASGTGNISSFTATNTGVVPVTATITVTPSYSNGGITCTGTSQVFTITVNPTPTVTDPADQVVCNNSPTATVTFTGSVTGTVYNWTNDDISIGLAASGTGDISSFTATNAGTVPVIATITVTPAYANGGTSCTGTPMSFTITVNPTPTVVQPSSQIVCDNASTTPVNFTGAVTGTIYNWTNNTPGIGLAPAGTGNIPSFTATNTGLLPVVATITVTPSYTNGGVTCTGTAQSFTITVNPLPTVDVGTTPVLFCALVGDTYQITGDDATNATTITWTTSGDGIFDNPNALHPLYTIGTVDIATGQATLTLTATNSCATVSADLTLNLTQAPLVAITTINNPGCEGTDITLNATNIPGGTYAWFDPNNNVVSTTTSYVIVNAIPPGGIYTVQVTGIPNGCPDTSNSVNVVVYPQPVTSPIIHN